MTPGVVSLVLAAQSAASRQHRFLWIGMSATVFRVVVAAVVVGITGAVVAVVLARRRAARRRT